MEESNFIPIDKMAVERKRILTPKTPGQVAYEKWAEQTATTRLWEYVHPTVRKKWEAVAQVVINQYERNACVRCGPNDPNPCADGKHWTH